LVRSKGLKSILVFRKYAGGNKNYFIENITCQIVGILLNLRIERKVAKWKI